MITLTKEKINKMKQTAVEWLFEQVWITSGEDLPELLEQAKEMEKEQIIDAVINTVKIGTEKEN